MIVLHVCLEASRRACVLSSKKLTLLVWVQEKSINIISLLEKKNESNEKEEEE